MTRRTSPDTVACLQALFPDHSLKQQMVKQAIDFYEGFEGESAIRFELENCESGRSLLLWSGYFNTLMHTFPLHGEWVGMALEYHVCTGWEVEPRWRVPDLSAELLRWEELKILGVPEAPIDCRPAYQAIVELMRDGVREGGDLWISVD